jgi:hypothetical protein
MKKKRFLPLAVVLAALSFATNLRADTLADRAPADAVGFVSWAGTDALGKGYEQSNLKKLIETLNLQPFIAAKFEEEMNKVDDPQKKADSKAAQELMLTLSKAPTAFYFGPVDFTSTPPGIKAAFYSQVGKDRAAALSKQINEIMERNKDKQDANDPPVAVTVAGDYLLVTIGSVPEIEKRLSGAAPADGLANVKAFQETMTQVGAANKPSAMLFYVNGEAAVKTLNEGIVAQGGMFADMWPKISDAIGLPAIRNIGFAGNFDGPNWTSQMFLGLTEKRTGYIALMDSKRLADDVLKLIPKAATAAGVTRIDLARGYQDVRDAMVAIDPQNGAANFDMGTRQFSASTGVDLLKDLFEPLDDAYIVFAVPNAKGESLRHAVVGNKMKDAVKGENALTTLENSVSAMMQRDVGGVNFNQVALPAPNDKVTAHVISGGNDIATAWTVHNGVFYFSLSQAGLQGAVENSGKGEPITANPQFAELWKKVGHKDMSGFSFLDLPKLAGEFYPLADKALKEHKADNPDEKVPFVMPPLEKLQANLSPAMAVYWTDKDGFHSKGTGPVPMFELLRPETLIQFVFMVAVAPGAARVEMEAPPAVAPNP